MLDALKAVAGALLVLLVLSDAIGTLVVTQSRMRAVRPTRLWYTGTWRLARALAGRLPSGASDYTLNLYPALSLLGLLVLWLTTLMFGWALVYSALGAQVSGSRDFGALVYMAGSQLVTPDAGISRAEVPRMLSLLETLTGIGTIALLISYLPALYGAYSRREAKLLTLDDPSGGRVVPGTVIVVGATSGGAEGLYRTFAEWEAWTAEVLESHVSYPMLALFRSQHQGQSWVSALGVVLDAAALASASIRGADTREAYMMYRRGRRTVAEITRRLHVPPRPVEVWLTPALFDAAWARLETLDLPLNDKEAAWERLVELRQPYQEDLQRLIDFLAAPHGFWGHSAEETVSSEVEAAERQARRRQSRASAPPAGGGR